MLLLKYSCYLQSSYATKYATCFLSVGANSNHFTGTKRKSITFVVVVIEKNACNYLQYIYYICICLCLSHDTYLPAVARQ